MAATLAVFDSLARVTGPALVDKLDAGVKVGVFTTLAKALDIPSAMLATALGLSARTLRTRKLLSADETERAFRVYRVLVRAREVLEDDEGARKWMNAPQRALGERTPLSLLVRDVGTEQVMNLLSAIEDGGYL